MVNEIVSLKSNAKPIDSKGLLLNTFKIYPLYNWVIKSKTPTQEKVEKYIQK